MIMPKINTKDRSLISFLRTCRNSQSIISSPKVCIPDSEKWISGRNGVLEHRPKLDRPGSRWHAEILGSWLSTELRTLDPLRIFYRDTSRHSPTSNPDRIKILNKYSGHKHVKNIEEIVFRCSEKNVCI